MSNVNPNRGGYADTDLRRRTQRERFERLRCAEGLPFPCDIEGCSWSFATAKGKAQHLSTKHGTRPTRERRQQTALIAQQSNIERIHAKFSRGGNIDTAYVWSTFISSLPKRGEVGHARLTSARPVRDERAPSEESSEPVAAHAPQQMALFVS